MLANWMAFLWFMFSLKTDEKSHPLNSSVSTNDRAKHAGKLNFHNSTVDFVSGTHRMIQDLRDMPGL